MSLSLAIVRALLLSRPALTAVTGQRIYAGSNLPSGYQLSQGEAILLSVRGGGRNYSEVIKEPNVQALCYAPDDLRAMRLAEEHLRAALNRATSRDILIAIEEGMPQGPFRDPTTNWPFVIAFYDVRVRDFAARQTF